MDYHAIDAAVAILLEARRTGRKLRELPMSCRPTTLEEAYAIQRRLTEQMSKPFAGWFVALASEEMRRVHCASAPIFGRILGESAMRAPAQIPSAGRRMSLELEYGFRLGCDVPLRREAYSGDEIVELVAAVVPSIELVDGRFEDLLAIDLPSLVADNGTDGIVALGADVANWRNIDLSSAEGCLMVDGAELCTARADRAMGHPINVLEWFVNDCVRRGQKLFAGELVLTGNCLARYCFGVAGQHIVADFGSLGTVGVTLT